MNKTVLVISFALALLICSCKNYSQPTLINSWKGIDVVMFDSTTSRTVSLPVEKYGYVNLTLKPDSTFTLEFAILKDVIVRQNVMGFEKEVTLVKARYESTRYGHYLIENSFIHLYGPQDTILAVIADRSSSDLHLIVGDESRRRWEIIFEQQD